MAIVGYFEGTDPIVLSRLTARGVQTLPLSNGVDMHGKNVSHLSIKDEVSIVVGYLHKVVPVEGINLSVKDIVYTCQLHSIPFCVIINEGDEPRAEKLLGEFSSYVQFSTPGKLFDKVLSIIG